MDDVKLDPRDPELRVWPLLTYYYGIGFQDLMLMPRWMRALYMSELPKFIGRDRLRAAEAALLPHVNQDARDQTFRDMRRAAELGAPARAKVLEKPKFDGTLRGIGIGVKRESGSSRGRRKPKVKPGTRMVPRDVASDETGHPEVTDA